ncbi:MAG: zinc ABC transporter substrate-binding protein [Rhodobacteraceae bacterium]|nr:zinc ABC transporter substrate-binding protein [Paracoccaceae bacterium]
MTMKRRLALIGMALGALANPALAKVPTIVTDNPVVQSLVWEVTAGIAAPEVLLGTGEDIHDFQLRPSQATALDNADIVIWAGHELAPWLDSALSARPGVSSLELLDVDGTAKRPPSNAALPGAGAHSSSEDPHAWLDPENAVLWLGAIAEALTRADPANAAEYHANATLAQARISALGADISARLSPYAGNPLVVSHDAYAHFAGRFGLTVLGTIRLGDAANPGARHISNLRTAIAEHPGICVFPEFAEPDDYLVVLTEGLSVTIGEPLDPEGRGLALGQDLYRQLLDGMARSIAKCLGDQHP